MLNLLLLTLLAGCASSLKTDKDLKAAPIELNQKFEDLDLNKISLDEVPLKTEEVKVVTPPQNQKKVPKQKKVVPLKIEKKPLVNEWLPTQWPYGIGERAEYSLRWGIIEGGRVWLEVLAPQLLEGIPVLHYRGTVKSSSALSLVYKVDDTIDSWVRLSDHLPLRQEIKQLESQMWGKRVVVFDQKEKMARYYAAGTSKSKGPFEMRQDDAVSHDAQDIFGSIYFFRFINNLENINFAIHDRFRNWNNKMTIIGKERIQVGAGTFDTIRLKLFPRVSGQLEPKGDVEIWLKDDSSKLLVQFKAKIKVGSITGELQGFSPGTQSKIALPKMKTPIHLDDLGQLK